MTIIPETWQTFLETHMSKAIQFYARNPNGRDFVVGDIHGCYDDLRQALNNVSFNPATDRLFSVGDLIDRGPQSTETLEWLAKPWFHACIGNHEEMAMQSLHNENIRQSWVLFNGGSWWMSLDNAAHDKYIAAFQQLPVAMEIETRHGGIGIVHADIPQGLTWRTFLAALESGDATAREIALWGRDRASGYITTPVDGIDQIVCGHTITADRSIHHYGNVWFIDTGAFLGSERGGHLSLLSLNDLFEETVNSIT